MAFRDSVVASALYWADPGDYRPIPDDIVYIFEKAGCETVPSYSEASWSLGNLSNGIKVGGQVKHWCGIFGAHLLRESGIDARWTLNGGKIVGSGVSYRPGRWGMEPGDIAIIPAAQHHFVITGVGGDRVETVEANSYGQRIKINDRPLNPTGSGAANQTIYGYYKIIE